MALNTAGQTGLGSDVAMGSSGSAFAPAWVRRAAAISWRFVAAAGLVAVLAAVALYLSTDTAAIIVGAIVASTFGPLVGYVRQGHGWRAQHAAAIVSVAALVGVILVAAMIVLAFAPYYTQILRVAQEGLTGLIERLTALGAPASVLDLLRTVGQGFDTWLRSGAQDLVGPVGTLLAVLVLGGFLTFYLLDEGDRAWRKATASLDPWRADTLTAHALTATSEVGGFLRGTALCAGGDAVSHFVLMTVLGIPLAGPLAVLVFIAGFVPYLGAIFATAVLILVALATKGVATAVILLALIGIAKAVVAVLVDRVVYANRVRIPPALVLIVVPAGAALFGIGGIFAAVPVVAAIIAFIPAITEVLGPGPDPIPPGSFAPLWLDRLAQFSWRALAIVAAVAIAIRLLVVPFFSAPVVIALVLACAMKPSTDALRRRGVGRTPAALIVAIASATVVMAILVVTAVSVVTQLPDILGRASEALGRLGLAQYLAGFTDSIGDSLAEAGSALVSNVATVFAALATAALLTYFFLRDGPVWWGRVLDRVRPERRRTSLGASGAQAARILNGSTLGTGIVSAFAGAAQVVIMTILGLPLAFPIGVLTFFGGFIPYVGSLISTGLAFLVTVAVGDTLDVVAMAIFTVVMNVVLANVIAPLVYGKTVNLHPAVILLAAPAGAAIGGLIGMFLIVPAIAIFGATWRSVIRLFESDETGSALPSSAEMTGIEPAT
jgi:predicted PurR-regulated permease PerM